MKRGPVTLTLTAVHGIDNFENQTHKEKKVLTARELLHQPISEEENCEQNFKYREEKRGLTNLN